ncbi:MAG: UDP-N-acetylglucosamine--N-acetylmuramyl-(pentapeptide) pyrophosphoryl-undecaprenol N-acetylglucosamine transferase [Phycisphaerae bacterium]|jgi:UDP-N-acetylglucosamine--N-acetylmuramyl-(pentapeptide) pyrophosphoryl-undecaprenol N-acetylglucosamine transferase
MAGNVYIFAGGGTGGHLYPGLAVAEALAKRDPAGRMVFACSNRPIDRRILDPLPYAIVPQPVRPFPGKPSGWPGFLWAWAKSASLSRRLLADLKPKAVLGLGGFAAGPVISAAASRGIPVALLNPDAVPGKANRLLAGKADVIFTQFEATTNVFPPDLHERIRCVGCPIRSLFGAATRDEALQHFGLRGDRKTLLVFGGSLLAEALSEAVGQLVGDLGTLAHTWQVLHITGSSKAEAIDQALRGAGLHTRTQGFCDRMDLAYAASDLVLSRAGAVTVAELAATGRPGVLMPYPYHADQHQRLNAAALVDCGCAIVCPDSKNAADNAATLRGRMLPLMRDIPALDRMAAAARKFQGRRAAENVADWLLAAGASEG